MFGMCGIFAEFERAMIVERVRSGMKRARAQGKHLGRPPMSLRTSEQIISLAKERLSGRAIARMLSVSEATVRRVLGKAG